MPARCPGTGAHLPAGASWMLSIPMALERREASGPGRRRDGLFPGTSSACGSPLTGNRGGGGGEYRGTHTGGAVSVPGLPTSSTEPSPMALPRRPRRLPGTSSDWGRHRVTGPGGAPGAPGGAGPRG